MTVTQHETAIVSPQAQLGQNIDIGAYSIIGANVHIADNVKIHSHVVIDGHTRIGAGTEIFPFAAIGLAPQHTRFEGEASELIIGENNLIREYVTLHPGTKVGTMKTIIGDNNLFYVGAHIAHDCVVGNNVILANHVGVGGHVTIGDFAYLGGYSAIHQFVRIGAHAIIGGGTAITADVIPFGLASGPRGALHGLNVVGLRRRGFEKEALANLKKAYACIFAGEGLFKENLAKTKSDLGHHDMVGALVQFIEDGQDRALCQPQK